MPRNANRNRGIGTLHSALVAASMLLAFSSATQAGVQADLRSVPAEERVEAGKPVANDEPIQVELKLHRTARISLRRALAIVDQYRAGTRIVDISFDGASGRPIYRVKALKGTSVWENTIDATTGLIVGASIKSPLSSLQSEDRRNLTALKDVRQDMDGAVIVAEYSASGKAISGGLANDRGKVGFVIVVVSGSDLTQVVVEPPMVRRRSRK